MGQSSSSDGTSPPPSFYHRPDTHSSSDQLETLSFTHSNKETCTEISDNTATMIDYTNVIPDECLALVFQFLDSGDRKRCSLVSHRWLLVEGQSRRRLALNGHFELLPFIPSIFSRFDSITKLALRCDRRSSSITDDALILISFRCPNLTRIKLRGCREITDLGLALLAKNCKSLKKFSCGSCMFGAKGMNAFLDNCSSLEELSVKRLRSINDGGATEPIGPCAAASSLKIIHLKELYNGQLFGPLITGSKNLKTLKLLRCLGDWDTSLKMIADSNNSLVEVHLERIHVSDIGLSSLSNCPNLEILHLVKTPDCTNSGLIPVAEHCKYLRKLHIDGWKTNRIGNDALLAISKLSVNLQELVLIGINPSFTSLEAIATNCQKLERLALCGSDSISDLEISCIASKCIALRKLCIKGCSVSNEGIEAFAFGCPNLVKIKVKKCRNVTSEIGDLLKARRKSLVVKLDVREVESEIVDASGSDNGVQEDVVEVVDVPSTVSHVSVTEIEPSSSSSSITRGNGGRASIFKSGFGLFGGRALVPCTFRRWSNGNSSFNDNS